MNIKTQIHCSLLELDKAFAQDLRSLNRLTDRLLLFENRKSFYKKNLQKLLMLFRFETFLQVVGASLTYEKVY